VLNRFGVVGLFYLVIESWFVKTLMYILMGIIVSVVLGYFWALSTNPFVTKITIVGEIKNYKSLSSKPTEIVVALSKGNPLKWETDRTHLIYKIDENGKFNITEIIGSKPSIHFRDSSWNYYKSFNLKDGFNDLSVDFSTLEKFERDYKEDKRLQLKRMY